MDIIRSQSQQTRENVWRTKCSPSLARTHIHEQTNEFHFITHQTENKTREKHVIQCSLFKINRMNSELRPLVVLTPFGYVDQRDNNACEWTRTRESEKNARERAQQILSTMKIIIIIIIATVIITSVIMCVCARKKGDHRNDKRSDSLWLLTMIANNRTVTRSNGHWTCWTRIVVRSSSIFIGLVSVCVLLPGARTPKTHTQKKENTIPNQTKPNPTQPN